MTNMGCTSLLRGSYVHLVIALEDRVPATKQPRPTPFCERKKKGRTPDVALDKTALREGVTAALMVNQPTTSRDRTALKKMTTF